MRAIHALLGALALGLSSCAGLPAAQPGQAPVAAAADRVVITATRGLILAELAYNSAAVTVRTGVEQGLIRPRSPLALKLAGLNTLASTALERARTARGGAEQAAAVAAATEAVFNLSSATPGGK